MGETELDEMATMVGSPANGTDYDLAALAFVLMNRFGGGAVQSVGELGAPAKPISDLVAEVGTIEDVNAVPEHQRENLLKKQFSLSFHDVDWVLCNFGAHWKTYFKDQASGDFCN